jgi:hypothetical protein
VPKISLISAALATLVLLSGCAPSTGAADPAVGQNEVTSQPVEPPEETGSKWAKLEGMAHYGGEWDDWFAAGTPDNGEFALFQQWRSPEKDTAGISYLETDESALGYSAECDDPVAQSCQDALSRFASLCQQLYDQAPSALSAMTSADTGVKDPTDGMLGILCPEVVDTYRDY